MAYKISGVKSETARVMVLKESDWSIESNTVISGSGAYEVDDLTGGTKTTLAQTEGDETIGFGNVSPIFTLLSSAATPEVFNSATSYDSSSATIDSTHVVITYRDNGNSNYGTSIIGTIDGTSIEWGSEYVFNNGTTQYTSSATIDSTHVLVSYRDSSSSGDGTSIIGTISNEDEISWGSEYVFNSGETYDTSSAMIDSTHVVISYRDGGNSSYGTSIIGTIDGTSISWGSEYVFNSATTEEISSTMLDSTHVMVSYKDSGNSSRGTSIIGTISGTSISWGDEYVFNDSGITNDISSVMLDSTHVMTTYRDVLSSNYGTSIIGTISNEDEIAWGSEYVFNDSGLSTYISSVMIDSTHVLVSYNDGGNSSYGTFIVGTIDGTSITWGSGSVFNSGETYDTSSVMLDSTNALVSYRDAGNSNYGTAVVLY